MTLHQEIASWLAPKKRKICPVPKLECSAPSHRLLQFPQLNPKPCILVFLRHCGCPFAEKACIDVCNLDAVLKGTIKVILVSHSSKEATNRWLQAVQQSGRLSANFENQELAASILIDEELELYAAWGLGVAKTEHVLNLATVYAAVSLGWREGLWDRSTESGSRWQTAGAYGIDRFGIIKWVHIPRLASDLADFEDAKAVLLES
ncbi:uncharacterized protein BDR25DRAFT_219348 [Lindgomyces ingoldianus]|uniref:Uncharacterized protein n=1 Tax=Lindgomyces ingoldianus TaxID=673940 RepID=A0ACB6R2Y4_9PLEO|nr:uncharacterized protein BDR25DRAFT_219348 [Lindgomyces ingoldianus]KAF2472687.1 hypothetical protein BDR25DRAFT_219348 [Lindgomyces ingoldianus]